MSYLDELAKAIKIAAENVSQHEYELLGEAYGLVSRLPHYHNGKPFIPGKDDPAA